MILCAPLAFQVAFLGEYFLIFSRFLLAANPRDFSGRLVCGEDVFLFSDFGRLFCWCVWAWFLTLAGAPSESKKVVYVFLVFGGLGPVLVRAFSSYFLSGET